MRSHVLLEPSTPAGLSHGIADSISTERLIGNLSRKHPFPRPDFSPIAAQQFQQLGRQLDITSLVALAQLNADHHPLAVDIGCTQMHSLTDAHPGAVHGAEDDMVRKGRSGL